MSGGTDLVDCLVYGNDATVQGGGISYWSSSSNLYSIVDCTIAGNSAPIGSAIMNESSNGGPPGTILLRNSLIAFNEGGQAIDSDADDWPLYIYCTDIYGNPGGDWVGHYADQLGQDGNISQDPLFCDLPSGDLHLASQSPCLPAANSCDTLMGAWGEGCTLTGLPPEGSAAMQAHLAPNSPNLFNGRTQLRFTLPRPGYVSLRIFDLLGRELAAPIAGRHMGPGEHRLSWDSEQAGGEALPSGIYFARLKTPWGIETRKMVLIQ